MITYYLTVEQNLCVYIYIYVCVCVCVEQGHPLPTMQSVQTKIRLGFENILRVGNICIYHKKTYFLKQKIF